MIIEARLIKMSIHYQNDYEIFDLINRLGSVNVPYVPGSEELFEEISEKFREVFLLYNKIICCIIRYMKTYFSFGEVYWRVIDYSLRGRVTLEEGKLYNDLSCDMTQIDTDYILALEEVGDIASPTLYFAIGNRPPRH